MKIKLSKQQIEKILADPEKAEHAKIKVSDPWWLIVVKVIAYICGLIIAGVGTVACTHTVGII